MNCIDLKNVNNVLNNLQGACPADQDCQLVRNCLQTPGAPPRECRPEPICISKHIIKYKINFKLLILFKNYNKIYSVVINFIDMLLK